MTTGIYKIENLITHKVYIGQSVHIEKRWQEHCRNSSDSLITKAIRKYGKDNFSFAILEECKMEELNAKEEYYIKLYDSVVPKGYNIEKFSSGRKTSFVHYSEETLTKIFDDIQNSTLLFNEIATKYDLDVSTIYYINRGEVHIAENVKYPLRTIEPPPPPKHCVDCGKIIERYSERCIECFKKATYIPMPSKDELLNELQKNNGNFTSVAKVYNAKTASVRRWCKKYNLSTHTSDYKQIKTKNTRCKKDLLKPCVMLDIQTNEVLMEFPSANAACNYLRKSTYSGHTHIREACEGVRKTAYGYKWKNKE